MTEPGFRTLPHFEAWSNGLLLDSGEPVRWEPWQLLFVADLFAGFRENWLIVPEGNGKTTLLSALGLYDLRYQPDSSIAIAASSKDQARWMYRQARGFVARSEYESVKGLRAYDGYLNVQNKDLNGVMEVFAADERTGDGIIPTKCILDELHRHRTLNLYRTWVGKLRKRPGAQLLAISTAGEPGGEFEDTREQIRQQATEQERIGSTFLRASHADRLVLHEYAVPEDGDVTNMVLVKDANPLSTVTEETLAEDFASPTMTMEHWRRFKCNLPTRSGFAAITEAEWAGAVARQPWPSGEPILLGADLGFKWDTTALTPLWMKSKTERVFGEARILVPPRDGNAMQTDVIKHSIREIHYENPVHTLVIDPSEARELVEWAEMELGCRVVEWTNSLPVQAEMAALFMEALREGWLQHQNDRPFTRQVMNAIARVLPRGDFVFERPSQTRNTSQQDRRVIDALIAAAMVHMVAATTKVRRPAVFDWGTVDAA